MQPFGSRPRAQEKKPASDAGGADAHIPTLTGYFALNQKTIRAPNYGIPLRSQNIPEQCHSERLTREAGSLCKKVNNNQAAKKARLSVILSEAKDPLSTEQTGNRPMR